MSEIQAVFLLNAKHLNKVLVVYCFLCSHEELLVAHAADL